MEEEDEEEEEEEEDEEEEEEEGGAGETGAARDFNVSSESPEPPATGKELAPKATRSFTIHATVYAWYDKDDDGTPQNRVVEGIVTNIGIS